MMNVHYAMVMVMILVGAIIDRGKASIEYNEPFSYVSDGSLFHQYEVDISLTGSGKLIFNRTIGKSIEISFWSEALLYGRKEDRRLANENTSFCLSKVMDCNFPYCPDEFVLQQLVRACTYSGSISGIPIGVKDTWNLYTSYQGDGRVKMKVENESTVTVKYGSEYRLSKEVTARVLGLTETWNNRAAIIDSDGRCKRVLGAVDVWGSFKASSAEVDCCLDRYVINYTVQRYTAFDDPDVVCVGARYSNLTFKNIYLRITIEGEEVYPQDINDEELKVLNKTCDGDCNCKFFTDGDSGIVIVDSESFLVSKGVAYGFESMCNISKSKEVMSYYGRSISKTLIVVLSVVGASVGLLLIVGIIVILAVRMVAKRNNELATQSLLET